MRTASAFAPGRVELLGNHTDYNEGVVLAAAIDRRITITGTGRSDEVIRLTSDLSADAAVEVSLADVRPQDEQRWANYPLGVVQQFQLRGDTIRGFEAHIVGDVPAGAGLSSSAALEVATAGLLMQLNDFHVVPLEVAKLCQRAENTFVGVQSGLLDQVTSVFGKADQLVYLDCRTEEIKTIPFPAGFALVIAETGVKHSLIAGEYNARREQCTAAAKALGVTALRDVTPEKLEAARGSLHPLLFRRAAHIVGEDDRVWRAVAALQEGDIAAVGELMNASHESSRVNFENSTAELDLLVATAQSLPGVLGSRLTGGGFGGGTVTLVGLDAAPAVVDALRSGYHAKTGHSPAVFICRIADGAAAGWMKK
ncbi:MAG: galactokinase [Verrucomicrobiota bacterium]|nr:galactokinase [Verrucomicrobiota bacterium]